MIEIEVEEYVRRFREPVETARGTLVERTGWFVHLSHDGSSAVGECAALPGWSTATHEQVGEALHRVRTAELDRFSASSPVPEAQAGLSAALAVLRGELVPGSVEVNSLLGADVEASLELAVAQGHTTHKIKVGLTDDTARLAAVAEGLPSGHRVRLDANGAWTVEQAQVALAEIDQVLGASVEYVEDPVGTLDDLATLESPVPVAVDELVRTTADVRRVLAERSAQCLVVKPMLVGGVKTVRTWAAQAYDSGVATVLTSAYETEVGLGHLHALAAELPGESRAHGLSALLVG